jgi:hypothetical protein
MTNTIPGEEENLMSQIVTGCQNDIPPVFDMPNWNIKTGVQR